MRTTLTLDDDLAVLLREEAQRSDLPFKEVVNRTLRLGLRATVGRAERPRFQTKAFPMGLRAGIDPTRLNDMVGELETEEFLRRERERSRGDVPPPEP